MQPFSATLAREQLTPQQQDVVVAGHRYRADIAAGRVRESSVSVFAVMNGRSQSPTSSCRNRAQDNKVRRFG